MTSSQPDAPDSREVATDPGDGTCGPEAGAGEGTAGNGSAGAAAKGQRRLALGDPLARTAAEDRPESWGETGESEAARLAFYRAQRPPHHGG